MSVFKHITRQFSKKCLSIVAITLVGISPVVANDDIDISYEKFTIDNGLTVIVHEDRKAPVVAVAV